MNNVYRFNRARNSIELVPSFLDFCSFMEKLEDTEIFIMNVICKSI